MKIYNLSGSSNSFRTYVVRDSLKVSALMNQPWGEPISSTWDPPDLIANSPEQPEADFSSLYMPCLLVVSAEFARVLSSKSIELLPVNGCSKESVLLNPLRTIRRFREENSSFIRVPSGAVIQLNKADFYAQDLPQDSDIFWFHDGNAPRFLLGTERFHQQIKENRISGLTFSELGNSKIEG